jgi:dephospho-CoA kinase
VTQTSHPRLPLAPGVAGIGAINRPVVVGLTGAIGSGKSNVLETLVSLGAEGIDADRVAHEVMRPEGPAYAAVVATFGAQGVLAPDGQVDRKRLGKHVFADPTALAQLEAVLHPAVIEVVRARVAASNAPLVAIEAIKLLESGLGLAMCDEVWVTTCSRRQQLARLAAGRGMSREEIRRRLARQMPVAEMVARADRVIDTTGTIAETGLLVLRAWSALALPFPPPRVRSGTADAAEGVAAVLNSIVREGGVTVLDRIFTPARERVFLRKLPHRSHLTVAQVGRTIAGFQIMEPYASYTGAMDHVAKLGSYVVAPLRGQGLGRKMTQLTFAEARQAGFTKFVVEIRADNPGAQAFYASLGFRPCGRLARQALVDGRYVDQILYEFSLGAQT